MLESKDYIATTTKYPDATITQENLLGKEFTDITLQKDSPTETTIRFDKEGFYSMNKYIPVEEGRLVMYISKNDKLTSNDDGDGLEITWFLQHIDPKKQNQDKVLKPSEVAALLTPKDTNPPQTDSTKE